MSVAPDNTNKIKDDLIGKQLGDYRLTSRLASGGMARVYKAMDYKLQRQAAIKVLEEDKISTDKTLTKRFQREAQAIAALEHDNIITIYQYGEQDGVYFLAMKLVKGKDLADEIAKQRKSKQLLEIDRAMRIMGQVASALDYAHANKIVHRDVKPSNILLDKDDKAILTDFGLVLRSSSETTMGTAFGTPRYIAPEQAISSNKAVPQSDIYALGVIFYEILTGQTPFNGDSPMEIALSQISDPPPKPTSINPNIPLAVERELLRALEKEPEKRHRTAAELVEAINRAYKAEKTNGKSPTSPSLPEAISSSVASLEGAQTINVLEAWDGNTTSKPAKMAAKKRTPVAMIAMIAVALLIAGVFILNGLSGGGGVSAAGGAPITLFYDENTFTMYNGGDYTLNVQKLLFVRGEDGGRDDFSGDRVPRDILPGDMCFQIVLQGKNTVPPQCDPISEHRHSQEVLMDPRFFHWRAETAENGDVATFEVRYDGQFITRCDTVKKGETGECRFNWPLLPTPVPE